MKNLLFIAVVTLLASNNLQAQLVFQEKVIDSDVDVAVGVALADLNGDNRLDVIGAPHVGKIKWYENAGQYTFNSHEVGLFITGTEEDSVFPCDMDLDGDVDIVCAERQSDKLVWLENKGQGNFERREIDATLDAPWAVHAADMDNDGDLDVLCAANFSAEIAWFENNGSQSFTKHQVVEQFDYATSVFAADLDGDNDLDIIGTAANGLWGQKGLIWWENIGNNFNNQHIISADIDPGSVYVYDADQDGDADVLEASNIGITLWKNNGNQQFTAQPIAPNYNGADSVSAVDLDGDNDLDILGVGYWQGTLDYWENDGNGQYIIRNISTDYPKASKVQAADLDGDGDIDLATASSERNSISIWINQAVQVSTANEIPVQNRFAAFPNPASDHVLFDCQNDQPQGRRLQLFAPSGQLVYDTQILEKQTFIPRNNLPAGAYKWILQGDYGQPGESGVIIFE